LEFSSESSPFSNDESVIFRPTTGSIGHARKLTADRPNIFALIHRITYARQHEIASCQFYFLIRVAD